MGVQVLRVPTCASLANPVVGLPGGSPDPLPVPRVRKLLLSLSPAPRQALSQVYFLSPEPDPGGEVAGGDSPGCNGTGHASPAGDIHPGLCGVTARKGEENLTLMCQRLSPHCCPEESSPWRCGAGMGRGSPGSDVHPQLIQNSSRAQPLLGVGGVGVPLPAWAVGSGDTVDTGGDTLQCPGFLLSKQLAWQWAQSCC